MSILNTLTGVYVCLLLLLLLLQTSANLLVSSLANRTMGSTSSNSSASSGRAPILRGGTTRARQGAFDREKRNAYTLYSKTVRFEVKRVFSLSLRRVKINNFFFFFFTLSLGLRFV